MSHQKFRITRKCPTDRVISLGEGAGYCLRLFDRSADNESLVKTEDIPLAEIFEAVAQGDATERFPQLTRKDIDLCHAFLATNVPDHEAYRQNNRGKKISILFDENLPYGLVPALSRELPNLSHVYLEGLGGYTDDFIFNRPWYQLKERSEKEKEKGRSTKYIIISRDQDLTDLAQEQWRARIRTSLTPENINFDDVNVVFHVKGEALANVLGAPVFAQYAKDILKRAYSNKAASYVIGQTGIHVEYGSSRESLIAQVERERLIDDFRNGRVPESVAALHKKNGKSWLAAPQEQRFLESQPA